MSGPWAYIVIFSGVTVPEFTAIIDKHDQDILNWLTVLPHTVFIVSAMTAADLTTFLRRHVPRIERILVLDANTDRNGWLPENAWDFLSHPSPPKYK
jgi:alpha-D-ribose 1-methylphosphonate 5-triphosphate synthase subunit PhnL